MSKHKASPLMSISLMNPSCSYHYVYNETLYDTYTSTASAGTLVRPSSTVTAKVCFS